jgi:hypothetical protein
MYKKYFKRPDIWDFNEQRVILLVKPIKFCYFLFLKNNNNNLNDHKFNEIRIQLSKK